MKLKEINFSKSLASKKLIYNQSLFANFWSNGLVFCYLAFFYFVFGSQFYEAVISGLPFGFYISLLLIIVAVTIFIFFSLAKRDKLKRIRGVSKTENLVLTRNIAHDNNWQFEELKDIIKIHINERKHLSGYGKRIIILLDKNDMLLNCISFDMFGNYNPLMYFSNKRMQQEFENTFIFLSNNLEK